MSDSPDPPSDLGTFVAAPEPVEQASFIVNAHISGPRNVVDNTVDILQGLFGHIEREGARILSIEAPNKLEEIFVAQSVLDERLSEERNLTYPQHMEPGELQDFLLAMWMQNACRAIIHEAVELEDSTDWKWWKNPKGIDRENIKVELVDILHFLVGAMIKMGMTPNDVYEAYTKKNAENHARQDGTVEGREDYASGVSLEPGTQ